MRSVVGLSLVWAAMVTAASVSANDPWITFPGGEGPGAGKRVVLLSGDEEYRSEEYLSQLAKILSHRHGFQCTVLFAVDPATGFVNPNYIKNVPGLEALAQADLMIVGLRFRDLPDDQMQHIDAYLNSGKPVIGLRTATHAFKLGKNSKFQKYSWDFGDDSYQQGFGRQVLGETWINHHGNHGTQAQRGIVVAEQAQHPVLRGIADGDLFGPTDVYGVRLPLPGDSVPLVLGQVVAGMKSTDPALEGPKNNPMMPIVWTKTYTAGNKQGRVLTTTMGSADDMSSVGLRRLMVNGTYWALGLEDKITPALNVDLVGTYRPSRFKNNGFQKDKKPADFARLTDVDAEGYEFLFDGHSLTNWDGNPEFWRVEEGTITGETTTEKVTRGNTFLIYRGGDVGEFELKFDYKIIGGNSGVQYRSFEVPDNKWVIGGYQADFEAGVTYSGINYGERFRGILANRGQKTVIGADHKPTVVGSVGESAEIQKSIKSEDWNEYHISAKDFTFEHRINNVVTSICTDDDTEQRRATGLLALQLHAGPPMKVQFRNIRIKRLANANGKTSQTTKKKALLLAGHPSHGFGAHDHTAGCGLLADQLNASGLPIEATVHSLKTQGWPNADILAAANTVVIYADGGGGHPFNAHIDELAPLMARGLGVVCLHYGVETVAGEPGDAFKNWTGAFFEPNWSVNPHWTAEYHKFPEHPITRGVAPFKTYDEWYYHMRFHDEAQGVTPLLTAMPPKETLSRPDGHHSGNPHVRAAIEKGEPQHMAWARQRPDGGRGFGCTGGHVHWNWGHPQFRKLVLNAIVWTAGLDVPAMGTTSPAVTVDDLLKNHDEQIPADFNRARIEAMLSEWTTTAAR